MAPAMTGCQQRHATAPRSGLLPLASTLLDVDLAGHRQEVGDLGHGRLGVGEQPLVADHVHPRAGAARSSRADLVRGEPVVHQLAAAACGVATCASASVTVTG